MMIIRKGSLRVGLRTASNMSRYYYGTQQKIISDRRNCNIGIDIIAGRRRLLSSTSSIPAVQNPNSINLPTTPIDFDIAAKIEGEESHICTVQLKPGEVLRAESGAMIFMTEGVTMDTKMEGASSAFRRFLTGQNVFLTDYKLEKGQSGTVCLGTDFPSKILKFELRDHGGALICQRGAFLASNGPKVDIKTEFTKSLSAGFFGGQGFILQRLEGDGQVLVKGGGTIVKRELKDGETLRVSSGSIVAFETSIDYDIQMMPGIKNAMFGGEGLFVTTLSGPGCLWLQGMPPDRMIAELARRIPGGGLGFGLPIGFGGGADSSGESDVDATGAVDAEPDTVSGLSSEESIQADRQATVASSGIESDSIDSNSPSALFGDAVDLDKSGNMTDATEQSSSESFGDTSSDFGDTSTFSDSFSEQQFDDNMSDFSNDSVNDGELFDDTPSVDSTLDEDSGSSGVIQQLWDFFMRDDD